MEQIQETAIYMYLQKEDLTFDLILFQQDFNFFSQGIHVLYLKITRQ